MTKHERLLTGKREIPPPPPLPKDQYMYCDCDTDAGHTFQCQYFPYIVVAVIVGAAVVAALFK